MSFSTRLRIMYSKGKKKTKYTLFWLIEFYRHWIFVVRVCRIYIIMSENGNFVSIFRCKWKFKWQIKTLCDNVDRITHAWPSKLIHIYIHHGIYRKICINYKIYCKIFMRRFITEIKIVKSWEFFFCFKWLIFIIKTMRRITKNWQQTFFA